MAVGLERTIEAKALASLDAPEMRRRYQASTLAQRRTLSWLFSENTTIQDFGHNFTAWLRGSSTQ